MIFKYETFSKVLNLYILNKVKTFCGVTQGRVVTVRENILENRKNPGQGKVREFHFQSGKSRKNEKSHVKSEKIKIFQKKVAS